LKKVIQINPRFTNGSYYAGHIINYNEKVSYELFYESNNCTGQAYRERTLEMAVNYIFQHVPGEYYIYGTSFIPGGINYFSEKYNVVCYSYSMPSA